MKAILRVLAKFFFRYRAYDTGRYAQAIDYRRDPDPPLTPDQQAWADTLLTAKGLLTGGPT